MCYLLSLPKIISVMLAILLYTIALASAIILVIYYFACTYEAWDDEDEKETIHFAWGRPRIVKSVLQEYPDEKKKPHVGHLPGSYEPPLLEPHKDVGDKQG